MTSNEYKNPPADTHVVTEEEEERTLLEGLPLTEEGGIDFPALTPQEADRVDRYASLFGYLRPKAVFFSNGLTVEETRDFYRGKRGAPAPLAPQEPAAPEAPETAETRPAQPATAAAEETAAKPKRTRAPKAPAESPGE